MRARLIYEDGVPRVILIPTGFAVDCHVETPPPDAGRGVWIEMTQAEAVQLHGRLGYLLWEGLRGSAAAKD